MRIVISGGSGLIGTALRAALVARGDHVISLVRPSSQQHGPSDVAWDPREGTIDVAKLNELGPIDAVVHLAGAGIADKRWSVERRAEILDSRVSSTSLLATAITGLATLPPAFVSGSAIGIYGDRGDEVLTEDSSPGEGFLAEVCQRWEEAAAPAVAAGVRTTFARTGIVLSTAGGALKKQLPLFRAGLGGPLSSGTQWFSWIGIADEVGALIAMIDDPSLVGPVNLTAPDPVTNATFTTELSHALHRPSVFRVPRFALKAALGAELTEEALLASQRVLPRRLEASTFSFASPDLPDALQSILAGG